MASWGEIAVGEHRHTSNHPSKSAIIGLIGAALGIRRDQDDLHAQLSRTIGVASLVRDPGIPVEDYHTVQTPPQAELNRGSHFRTRKDELSIGSDTLSTVLSRRDYRCDPCVSVCIWKRETGIPYSLDDISRALAAPVFTLYLGRKSCPPGLPLRPLVVEAPSILGAFGSAGWAPPVLSEMRTFPSEADLFWDADGNAGVGPRHVYSRRDEVNSRRRWTFSNRFEHFETVPIPPLEG